MNLEDRIMEEASKGNKDGTRFCFIDELAGKKIGLWN